VNKCKLSYKIKQSDADRIMDHHLQRLQGHGRGTMQLHTRVIQSLLSFLASDERNRGKYLNCNEHQLLRWMITDVRGKANHYAASRLQVVDCYIEQLRTHGLLPNNPLRRIKPRNSSPSWNRIVTVLQSPRPLQGLQPLRPTPPQHGPLYCHIQKYIELQQSLGKKYTTHCRVLCRLDALLTEQKINTPGAIQTNHIRDWLGQMQCNRTIQLKHTFVLKHFVDYLIGIGVMKNNPAVPVIHEYGRTPPKRFRPFIFTKGQIARMLKHARQLTPNHLFKLRPQVCYTMLVLLYALGLRNREVCNLRFCDVDMERHMLRIEGTKFHKSRLVPFGPQVHQCLMAYMGARRKIFLPIRPDDPLFITYRRHPIGQVALCSLLRLLAKRVLPPLSPSPRIHDLRHTFAVHRLLRWYREGADVQSKLLLLSAFMGHTEINSTEVYLTITMDLLKEANKRFYQNCGILIGKETTNEK